MHTRFLHFADCHLGYQQYNSKERANDFARAFIAIVDTAVAQKVDFVILAGDLFHKRSIDALTLNQAVRGLERLRAANIPCIAVEGNHELAYYQDTIGWMEFLAQSNLLVLLTAKSNNDELQLIPYSKRSGSYFDPVPGVRVFGMRYQGASTPVALEKYVEALAKVPTDGVEYTIFVAHAGVEEALPEQGGGLSLRQWSLLQPHVNYLALGHVHKPFQFDGWIYNPGSPETCSATEVAWEDRGYYLVEVNADAPITDEAGNEVKHTVKQHQNPRRRFIRQLVKVDLLTSPLELYDYCRDVLARKAGDLRLDRLGAQQRPIAELMLTGALQFERSALDLGKLEEIVNETMQPLLPLVKNLTTAQGLVLHTGESMNRSELERQVLTDLLNQDARYRPQSEQWANVALSLKRLALANNPPEMIIDELAGMMQQMQEKND